MIKKVVSISVCLSAFFFLTGCADQKITFKGRVYEATIDSSTTTLVTILGPIEGARVRERKNPQEVRTDAGGNYELTITIPPVIGYQSARLYTIECSGSETRGKGASAAVNVYASAGDTVFVRDMALYQIAPNPDQ